MTDLFRALVVSAMEFHLGAERSEELMEVVCGEMRIKASDLAPEHMEDFAGRIFARIESQLGQRKSNFIASGLRRFGWIANKEDIPIPIPSEPRELRPPRGVAQLHAPTPDSTPPRTPRQRTIDSSDFTFDRFIVSRENSAAHDISQQMALGAPDRHQVVYIYGPEGCGKSHLLRAVQNHVLTGGDQNMRAEVAPAHILRRDYEAVSSEDDARRFWLPYSDLDILLVDDIELVGPEPDLQSGLAALLRDLADRGSRVLVAGGDAVDRIDVSDELREALAAHPIHLEYIGPQARMDVLRQSMRDRGWLVDDLTLRSLARHCPGNIRRLKSALFTVVGRAFELGSPPSPHLVDEVLGD